MNQVNPNEAPRGYIAVEATCEEWGVICWDEGEVNTCALVGHLVRCIEAKCRSDRREDGCDVIFIKKEVQQ